MHEHREASFVGHDADSATSLPFATGEAYPPLSSLAMMVDELIGVESGGTLTEHLEALLTNFGAVPARLYLYNDDAGIFFSAAHFGCEKEAPDLPRVITNELPLGYYPLLSAGEWIGLLYVSYVAPRYENALQQLCIVLAPILVSVQRHQALVDECAISREEILKIVKAGELLRHHDLHVVLVKILELAIESVSAEVGAIMTLDDHHMPHTRVAMGLREDHLLALRLRDGRSIAAEVLATGKRVLLNEAQVVEMLDLTHFDGHVRGLLALPLSTREKDQGVVILINPSFSGETQQWRLADTVCTVASIALDNAMLVKATVDRERLSRELQLARSIQAEMSPEHGLEVGRFYLEGMSQPCNETGGDYFTFHRRGSGAISFIGDVTGHGLGAALFATMAHALIQQQIHAGTSLDQAFQALNDGLRHAQKGRFMTVAAVEILEDGSFSYLSAGHNSILWIHAGQIHWLESSMMPLGIMPIEKSQTVSAGHLDPGDLLILYTDGFTEAQDAQRVEFGEERFAAAALKAWSAHRSASEIMAEITCAVEEWTGSKPRRDDLTMVVIGRKV